MIRFRSDINLVVNGPALRLNTLIVALRVLAVLSLIAMVVGPSLSGEAIGLSPVHSHVFLTDAAATDHSHTASDGGALESEVVNTGSHSADSVTGVVHLHDATTVLDAASLMTTSRLFGSELEYSDPYSTAPVPPPRLS